MNRGLSRVNPGSRGLISAGRPFCARARAAASIRSQRHAVAWLFSVRRPHSRARPTGGRRGDARGRADPTPRGRRDSRARGHRAVVAVLARARSNDPRRDETRRKSEPRRAGFERGGGGGGGDDAALRRGDDRDGDPGTGEREANGRGARRAVGGRGRARSGAARGGGRAERESAPCRSSSRRKRETRGARLEGRPSRNTSKEFAPTARGRTRGGPVAGQAKRTTAPGRPGRRRGRGRGRGRGRRRVYARRGKRFFGAERVFRGIRRFVRGGVRVVPRVLLLRRRVSRRGGLLRGLRAARDVRRSESLLSGSRGERRIERSAADELDGPRPSPGHVRVGRFRNASRRTDF